VGLGNPGDEFEGTRHNVGSDAVRLLWTRHRSGRPERVKGLRASVGEVLIEGVRVALGIPTTYMNDSGEAVAPLVRRSGIEDPDHLVVIHDELDLPPGRLRVKVGGGTAGHNGLRSVQAHLHSDAFVRIRIGIGKPPGARSGADHVLNRPSRSERALLVHCVEMAADAVEVIATEGVEAAMNRFNVNDDVAG